MSTTYVPLESVLTSNLSIDPLSQTQSFFFSVQFLYTVLVMVICFVLLAKTIDNLSRGLNNDNPITVMLAVFLLWFILAWMNKSLLTEDIGVQILEKVSSSEMGFYDYLFVFSVILLLISGLCLVIKNIIIRMRISNTKGASDEKAV